MWLWMKLFGHPPAGRVALGAIAVAIVIAWACAELLTSIVRRSFARPGAVGDGRRQHARTTARVVRIVTLLVLTSVFIPPVLELFGEPMKIGLSLSQLTDWLFSSGPKILLIAMLAYVLTRAVALGTSRFERHLADEGPGSAEYAKRARTLGDMARNVASAVITVIAGLYILKELHFDIMPLLTGAGIAGLAIGFGAQTLVKDVISGFFLILENQVRVGDMAEINGTAGLVEALYLRTLVLRDARGALYVFPCGSINTVANLTKDFSYALLDVQVHKQEDAGKILDVLQRVGAALQQDTDYGSMILGPIEILGVDTPGRTGATIRIRLKTIPLRQWDVARELRRRVRREVGYEGIDIPFVQTLPAAKPKPADVSDQWPMANGQ